VPSAWRLALSPVTGDPLELAGVTLERPADDALRSHLA